MNEYISREAVVRYLKEYSEKECNSNSPYGMITSSVLNKAERELSEIPAADVQLVDAKEILRHLDSMMICIGNAYDTSHYLLESDMEFIEKQEKIIKELLSGKE